MTAELKTFNLVPPKGLEAKESDEKRLDFKDVYHRTHVTVQVPHYVDMFNGHAVRVRWINGRYKYDTETLIVGTPGLMEFKIPRLEVIDSIGAVVTVNYSVRLTPGTPLIISKSLTLNVDKQAFDLPEPRLSNTTVTVKFLNMKPGYVVRVRWHGVVVRDTERKPIQNSSSMAFDIPATWIKENAGKTVLINYSVERSGSNDYLMFSRLLRITF